MNNTLFEERLWVFTKSLPDHWLWLNGSDYNWNLIIKQTLDDIFENLQLHPNTKSFGLEERLSYSFLHQHRKAIWIENSYRNNGIIFQHRDNDKQDIFMPSDLLAITTCNDLPCDKNDVFENIVLYYANKIIDEWHLLGTENIATFMNRLHHLKMIAWDTNISDQELILKYINIFRQDWWYKPLNKDHMRMLSYNECIKFTPLKIKIIGTYWSHKNIIDKSKKYNIPNYNTLKDYLNTVK